MRSGGCADGALPARAHHRRAPRPVLATHVIRSAIGRHGGIVAGRTAPYNPGGGTAKRPALAPLDRGLLVLLASRLRIWASALLIVQPETVLRRHRQGFRLFWRRKSAPRSRPSPLAAATIELIKRMARDNPLWDAERIRGELLKLGIRVSKRTIQKHTRQAPGSRPSGQPWA